jgi:1-acyl-sn-glycerol-3-phosphate acyltransferase
MWYLGPHVSTKKHTPQGLLPPNIPQRRASRAAQWLLRLWGWRLDGELPNRAKLVVAAAPHTSNMDFIVAMLIVLALGLRISFLIKKEVFVGWPINRWLRALGAVPVDRQAPTETVDQLADWMRGQPEAWVVITPEGTRRKVERWKTGYLRLAEQAEVPVLLVAWDYPSKTMKMVELWQLSGNHLADAYAMQERINQEFVGRNAQWQ